LPRVPVVADRVGEEAHQDLTESERVGEHCNRLRGREEVNGDVTAYCEWKYLFHRFLDERLHFGSPDLEVQPALLDRSEIERLLDEHQEMTSCPLDLLGQFGVLRGWTCLQGARPS